MLQVFRRHSYVQKPWKNGQGITSEIALYPQGAHDTFLWRLSMADIVASGPFSSFPGIDRTLVLIEGPPVQLRHGNHEHLRPKQLSLWEAYAFDGGLATEAKVQAAGRDFNLMCRRGHVKSEFTIHSLLQGQAISVEMKHDHVAIFCVDGQLSADYSGPGMKNALLDKYDTLFFERQSESFVAEQLNLLAKGSDAHFFVIKIDLLRS